MGELHAKLLGVSDERASHAQRRSAARLEAATGPAEPGCGAGGRPQSLARLRDSAPSKSRMQFDYMKFQQSLKTLEFQRS